MMEKIITELLLIIKTQFPDLKEKVTLNVANPIPKTLTYRQTIPINL